MFLYYYAQVLGWLIERGVLSKEYIGSLESLADKVAAAQQATAEKIRHIAKEPVLYFFCQKALKYFEKQWRDLISRYEKQNLYLGELPKLFLTQLAEVAERLNELCFLIPKCKSAIADRQKLITDLQKKVKEFTINQLSKEAELERFRKRFEITYLLCALPEFYLTFFCSIGDTQKASTLPCNTLRLLLSSGHVTVYEWKTGRAPDCVGKSDDYLADMLTQERKRVVKLKAEIETAAQSADLEVLLACSTTLSPADMVLTAVRKIQELHYKDHQLEQPLPLCKCHCYLRRQQHFFITICVNHGYCSIYLMGTTFGPIVCSFVITAASIPFYIYSDYLLFRLLQLTDVNLLDISGESTDVKADTTDLNEIDFGDLAESFGIDVVDVTESAEAISDTCATAAAQNTLHVARGANARLLLDTSEGRASLISDLEELTTFLQRMIENQRDFHAATEDCSETQKLSGGMDVHSLAPIYHQILQVFLS
ncbi:unnamed protein product [Schistocephalus solidus]|uniref:Uncharacterized protein n=1 Tax=Schistocephalus solidus TaxID=70667 RepID=A0A3P7EB43_SCHSO|nr:unnamed protein product [Schistocephalus solidus]